MLFCLFGGQKAIEALVQLGYTLIPCGVTVAFRAGRLTLATRQCYTRVLERESTGGIRRSRDAIFVYFPAGTCYDEGIRKAYRGWVPARAVLCDWAVTVTR